MVAFSSLRGKATSERLARISKAYANNRPLVQRILNISFVLYVLSTTYYSMSGGGRKDSSKQGKGKARTGGKPTDGKPERVAVRILLVSVFSVWLIPRILQVDAIFYSRLSRILKIVIPGIRSKEALLLLMHSSLLVFRTAISLYVAALDGKCVMGRFISRSLLIISFQDRGKPGQG